jgi:hypothetical protein
MTKREVGEPRLPQIIKQIRSEVGTMKEKSSILSDNAADGGPNPLLEIAMERNRQVHGEGYSPAHDDFHMAGELAQAASAYAHRASIEDPAARKRLGVPMAWPWLAHWWKPTDPRRDLVKAGALIVAEIERLDRISVRRR